ncbi:hypothetical protein O7623_26740 [Solwaraspora sp. WMMD791]|uniref:hypothetical protein n=1 Tax=Solwaraspora sp. WMMD791 TaxID=3016086 RepID=UPI00249AC67C|nr:hypothetical protein [Solwaraspora sp. WMMD791]WFE26831.1 hypothetical protein O7623_26740 [Solwaraspora sp. WMMD791]
MRYLIVRTEIRAVAHHELVTAVIDGRRIRDEQTTPEQRRQTLRATDRESAMRLARALSTVGSVRSGRHRVKVVPVPGDPTPAPPR